MPVKSVASSEIASIAAMSAFKPVFKPATRPSMKVTALASPPPRRSVASEAAGPSETAFRDEELLVETAFETAFRDEEIEVPVDCELLVGAGLDALDFAKALPGFPPRLAAPTGFLLPVNMFAKTSPSDPSVPD